MIADEAKATLQDRSVFNEYYAEEYGETPPAPTAEECYLTDSGFRQFVDNITEDALAGHEAKKQSAYPNTV